MNDDELENSSNNDESDEDDDENDDDDDDDADEEVDDEDGENDDEDDDEDEESEEEVIERRVLPSRAGRGSKMAELMAKAEVEESSEFWQANKEIFAEDDVDSDFEASGKSIYDYMHSMNLHRGQIGVFSL